MGIVSFRAKGTEGKRLNRYVGLLTSDMVDILNEGMLGYTFIHGLSAGTKRTVAFNGMMKVRPHLTTHTTAIEIISLFDGLRELPDQILRK